MKNSRLSAAVSALAVASLIGLTVATQRPTAAQVSLKGDDLVGTWELVSTQDMKTGVVTKTTGTAWLQFTRSHWTIVDMGAGRTVTATAEFDKLSRDAQVKTNYARIWNDKNEQIFAARGGTYTLVGDKLHHPATLAIYTNIIGIDRVLKITRLDKSTLIAQTEYPDDPTESSEVTYRRID